MGTSTVVEEIEVEFEEDLVTSQVWEGEREELGLILRVKHAWKCRQLFRRWQVALFGEGG